MTTKKTAVSKQDIQAYFRKTHHQVSSVREVVDDKGQKMLECDVPGDGNCVLYAVILGLKEAGYSPIPSPQSLRAALVKELRKPGYSDFWSAFQGEASGSYLENMSKDGTWLGEPEFAALSKLLEIPLIVYEETPLTLGNTYTFHKNNNPTVKIVRVKKNHYHALIPQKPLVEKILSASQSKSQQVQKKALTFVWHNTTQADEQINKLLDDKNTAPCEIASAIDNILKAAEKKGREKK